VVCQYVTLQQQINGKNEEAKNEINKNYEQQNCQNKTGERESLNNNNSN